MNNIIQTIISFMLVFPFVLFIIVYVASIKISRKKTRAFGHAADVTTLLLFFSVPIAIQSVFHIEVMGILMGLALILSVVLTILEWKSQKEIELLPLLRKIWRFLFLLLSVTFFVIWCIGLILKVIEFVK